MDSKQGEDAIKRTQELVKSEQLIEGSLYYDVSNFDNTKAIAFLRPSFGRRFANKIRKSLKRSMHRVETRFSAETAFIYVHMPDIVRNVLQMNIDHAYILKCKFSTMEDSEQHYIHVYVRVIRKDAESDLFFLLYPLTSRHGKLIEIALKEGLLLDEMALQRRSNSIEFRKLGNQIKIARWNRFWDIVRTMFTVIAVILVSDKDSVFWWFIEIFSR